MALKVLMLRKQIDEKRKALNEINEQLKGFELRETELEKAIEEAQTEEEKQVVTEEVEKFENEKKEANEQKESLEEVISNLENELKEEEKEVEVPQPEEQEEKPEENKEEERGVKTKMETRQFFNLNAQERDMFFAREDVKAYLGEMRSAIKEKRALTNVGLTIPQVFIGLIRENIINYSKLYKHCWVRQVGGTARAVVMGTIPEAKPSFNVLNA